MNRKIEIAKQKRTQKAQEQALVDKQIQSQERLTKAVDGLYELLNGQEQYDFDKLHTQLVEIDKRLDLAPHFKSLEKSITTSHKPYDNKTKIEGFSELLRAVKTNKPIPSDVKLDKLEKAVVSIEQYIKDQSEPEDKGAENYKPVRRVVKMGNRFFFDDNMTSGGGGGSGGNTDGLTDAQLRASPVPVTATIDTTGLATSTKQSDGSQKTQIVDSGGEAATVTGGKLDVNATASLAGTALPIAGASEGVGVAIVDGSGNQITSFGGGTQYTEDAAAAANPVGTALNMVRDDARAGGLTTTDGDNVAARGNNKGELYVKATDTDALLTTIDADTGTIATEVAGLLTDTELRATPVPVSGTVTSNLGTLNGAATSAKQDTIIGHLDGVETLLTDIEADTDTLAVVGSGTEATAQRVTIATDSTGVLSVDDNGSSLTVDNAGLTELASAINSDKVDVNIASSGIALGGTSAADDADFTAGTTAGTPAMGVYESTPTAVTDGDLGTVGITSGRRLKTSATIDAALPAGTNNIGDVDVVSMPTTTVQATNLDIRDLTNTDVVTAELSATDNAVLDAIAASTAAIDTDTTTLIGHVDGVETAVASTNTKLDTVNTNLGTIDGRVDGLETLVTSTNTKLDTVNTNLGTIDGRVDGLEASNSAIQTATELLDDTVATLGTTTYTETTTKGLTIGAVRRDANTTLVGTTNEVAPLQVNATGELKVAQIQALPAGTNNIGDVDIASIAAGDNNIGNVDVVTIPVAFNSGATSATTQRVITATDAGAAGRLAANSGVDIGDVDVTSAVSATLDHGSNRDVDTAAEQITSTSFAAKFGVTLRADSANTGILYIGNSDVTAGTTAATDGIPLAAGDSITLPVSNSNIPYAIASANNQIIYWVAV
jgi:hypothetical protein